MVSGPVIFGFDGSAASERALLEGARLLGEHEGLVVVVWEPGLGYELLIPSIAAAPIDVRAVFEVDEKMYENAQQLAELGASMLREAGMKAGGLAVADVLSIGATLVRLAGEHDAAAVVVGTHGHSAMRELIVGSTARELITKAPCPVVVVRGGDGEDRS